MVQGGGQPTVMVKSDIVGRSALPLATGRKNHRYSVPDFAKWEVIVTSNEKSFVIDTALNRILSASAKAKKVGGLYLALNGVAVKPTDAVDAKKEYAQVEIGGGSDVEPEPTSVTLE